MNPSHRFCSYPYYFPNKQAFPYENVGVGDPLLRGPIGSSPFDASLPWPSGPQCHGGALYWTHPTLLPKTRRWLPGWTASGKTTVALWEWGFRPHPVEILATWSSFWACLFCVHTLLNLPSQYGNYPLMAAVTNNHVKFAARLLVASPCISEPLWDSTRHLWHPPPCYIKLSTAGFSGVW